jgi:hypothetical protein
VRRHRNGRDSRIVFRNSRSRGGLPPPAARHDGNGWFRGARARRRNREDRDREPCLGTDRTCSRNSGERRSGRSVRSTRDPALTDAHRDGGPIVVAAPHDYLEAARCGAPPPDAVWLLELTAPPGGPIRSLVVPVFLSQDAGLTQLRVCFGSPASASASLPKVISSLISTNEFPALDQRGQYAWRGFFIPFTMDREGLGATVEARSIQPLPSRITLAATLTRRRGGGTGALLHGPAGRGGSTDRRRSDQARGSEAQRSTRRRVDRLPVETARRHVLVPASGDANAGLHRVSRAERRHADGVRRIERSPGSVSAP